MRKSNQLVQEVLMLFMWRKTEESLENHLRHEGHRPSNEGGGMADGKVTQDCQEIGLVAIMFFFELLISYVSLTISLYVSLTNLFSIILFLIC